MEAVEHVEDEFAGVFLIVALKLGIITKTKHYLRLKLAYDSS